MNQIRKRLTYANVMSSIAVFLVLGGASAFAASQLGTSSVGSKQLKPNSVTAAKIKRNAVTSAKIKKNAVSTAKIKNGAVTGTKVNVATLPTVPSAAVANALPPLEATHLVGAAGEPGFESGSGNVASELGVSPNQVGFYKDREGIVHLQGIAKTGSSSSGFLVPVFTLPPGFRPAAGRVVVLASGAVIGGSGTSVEGHDLSGKVDGEKEKYVPLDGITFRAES